MAASSSESTEYKTLAQFRDKLITAFKVSYLTKIIANELVTKGVIPQDVLDKVLTVGVDDETKAALIVNRVLDQVKVCPEKYHDFMALPPFKDQYFHSLHGEITAVYGSLKAVATQTTPNLTGADQPQTSSQEVQCDVKNAHSGVVITRSAKEIMEVVSQAANQIKAGNSSEAVVLLEQIQGDARSMCKETKHLIQQSIKVKEYCKAEVEKNTSKISEATIKKTQLEAKVQRAEIELKAKQNRVSELKRQRSSAESRRDSAREESNRQWDKKRSMTGTTVAVGMFGLFLTAITGGAAAPLAVAATTACGMSAAGHGDEVKKAEDEISQCSREISNINDDISSCNQRISDMQREIQQLQGNLTEYEEKCGKCEREKQHVQGTIAFLQESQAFWEKFENLIELRSTKTDLLHEIIQKADSKENREILQCRGTKTMVTSFVDTWEQLRKEAQSGESYIFKISFKCTQCNKEFNDLPSMKDGNFMCSFCNQTTQALEN